jgi:catechol 2,3-dioxygenase-like lactoylglutathione lyase family enzyme
VSESPHTQSVIVLDPSQVSAVLALAAAHGVEVDQVPERGIEPVTTVSLVLLGTATGVGAVLHALEQRKGGQVVDLRPGAPKAFFRTPEVLYGLVIIVAVDGNVKVEVMEPDGMFGKVVSTLPQLLSSGGRAKHVAQAVKETFGPDVKVETVEIPPAGGDL